MGKKCYSQKGGKKMERAATGSRGFQRIREGREAGRKRASFAWGRYR